MSVAYRAILEASQEVPPTISTGSSGLGTFVFDTTAVAANYVFHILALDFGPAAGRPPQTAATADDVVSAHFHNQVRGQNGPVVFGQINPAQDNDDLAIFPGIPSWILLGRWETSDPASSSISNFAGVLGSTALGADAPLYFNIHTVQFPGGAIRGQLVAIADDNANTVSGTELFDELPGLAGNDSILGLVGPDVLMGNMGNDTLLGGEGTDTAYGGLNDDVVDGDGDSDVLFGNEGADTVFGGAGSNTIVGGQDSADGANSITAGAQNDRIWGNGGNDTIAAGDGPNLVFGGFGDDSVLTGSGNDTIWGNEGNDTMAGGAGADRYTFAGGSGSDQINSFAFGEGDRLDLQGQTFTTGTSADGDVVLQLSGGGTVELNGIAPGSFSPNFAL